MLCEEASLLEQCSNFHINWFISVFWCEVYVFHFSLVDFQDSILNYNSILVDSKALVGAVM